MLKLQENKPIGNHGSLVSRKRKTKDPCLVCYLHRDLCICDSIPRLELSTKISLVIHAKELKRTTNTGRLALHALANSELRVRGLTTDAVDLSDLLISEYRTCLLYPSDDAIELKHFVEQEDSRPVQLIVPDGNWRQASKVHYRHKELQHIPRVIVSSARSTLHMRAETKPEGMATLEAIAQALTVIEGAPAGEALMKVYRLKLEQTLKGRGINLLH